MNSSAQQTTTTNIVGKIDGITILTDTPAGASFVKKVCHPPSILPSDYLGTPDASAPNVVLVEMKGETNLPPILNYYDGPGASPVLKTENSTSMLFLTTSGIQSATYCFLRHDSGWVQPSNEVIGTTTTFVSNQICPAGATNSGYNINNLVNDASMMRTTYKSNTFYLNATDFNNQGTVTTAKFKPKIVHFASVSSLLDTLEHLKDKINCLKQLKLLKPSKEISIENDFEIIGNRKVMIKQTSPIEYTNEDIYKIAAEYEFRVQILEFAANPNASVTAITGIDGQRVLKSVFPDSPSDVLNLSPKACTRPAKEGSFVVQQNVDPIAFWHNTPSIFIDGSSGDHRLVVSAVRCFNTTTNLYSFAPLKASIFNSVANTLPLLETQWETDSPWNNLDFSWTLFDGLTIPSTVGTTLSSVPYITIKSYVGFELQASFHGSLESFQRLLPLPDVKAVQMVAGIFHARPDSLPASANDLGTIVSIASTFIPQVVGWIKDLFGKKGGVVNPPAQKEREKTPKRKSTKPKKSNSNVNLNKTIKSLENKINNMSISNKKQTSTLPTYQAQNVKMPGAPRRNKNNIPGRTKMYAMPYVPPKKHN